MTYFGTHHEPEDEAAYNRLEQAAVRLRAVQTGDVRFTKRVLPRWIRDACNTPLIRIYRQQAALTGD